VVKTDQEGNTLSSTFDELQELHDQNIELLELLIVIGNRFFDYVEKYDMQIDGMESLAALIERAQILLDEIATPYQGNPVRQAERSPPGNAIKCPIGGWLEAIITIRIVKSRTGSGEAFDPRRLCTADSWTRTPSAQALR
jgi:hypothetical protein